MQNETRNISVVGFSASYIRNLTVIFGHPVSGTCVRRSLSLFRDTHYNGMTARGDMLDGLSRLTIVSTASGIEVITIITLAYGARNIFRKHKVIRSFEWSSIAQTPAYLNHIFALFLVLLTVTFGRVIIKSFSYIEIGLFVFFAQI